METTKIADFIKNDNIVIPIYMLRLYKKYNLNLDEFVFLMYLYNKKFVLYDPVFIADELNIDINEVMGYVSQLADKGLITLDIDKTSGIIEEKINLNNFYEKVSLSLISNVSESKNNDSIYEEIEREFNRKLSPMEREVVTGWQNDNISDDLIHEALKEASINGVSNLRYMDKILFEWHKKGFKQKDDIKKEEIEPEMEIFNYNWVDDEEEI